MTTLLLSLFFVGSCPIKGVKISNESYPLLDVFLTPLYGDDYASFSTTALNQGRINSISDWGICVNGSGTNYINTLYIRNWNSDKENVTDLDKEMGYVINNWGPVACNSFALNDSDYIIGFNIYDSSNFIHGVTFYTLLGNQYDCYGNSENDPSISKSGTISYYYNDTDFWYLTGFKGRNGAIIDSLQLQFTHSDSITTNAPTNIPSSIPSAVPSNVPSGIPSIIPSSIPSAVPSVVPTTVPSGIPSITPSSVPSTIPSTIPTIIPTIVPSSVPTISPSTNPSSDPTSNSIVNLSSTYVQMDDANISEADNNELLYVIISASIVTICIVFIILFMIWFKKRKRILKQVSQMNKNNDINIIEDDDIDVYNNEKIIVIKMNNSDKKQVSEGATSLLTTTKGNDIDVNKSDYNLDDGEFIIDDAVDI